MVLALAAASVPPTSVAAIRPSDGIPRLANSIVGTVVTRSNSMIRGLVSATRPRSTAPAGRRTGAPVGADAAAPTGAFDSAVTGLAVLELARGSAGVRLRPRLALGRQL